MAMWTKSHIAESLEKSRNLWHAFCSFNVLFSYCKINAHIISSALPSVPKKKKNIILPSFSHHPSGAWLKISISNNVVEKNMHLAFSDRFTRCHNVYHLLALSCCSMPLKLWQLRPALAPCIFCLHLVFDTLLFPWQTITGLVLHVWNNGSTPLPMITHDFHSLSCYG